MCVSAGQISLSPVFDYCLPIQQNIETAIFTSQLNPGTIPGFSRSIRSAVKTICMGVGIGGVPVLGFACRKQ
jgi:hypothetical protein